MEHPTYPVWSPMPIPKGQAGLKPEHKGFVFPGRRPMLGVVRQVCNSLLFALVQRVLEIRREASDL